MASLLKRGKKYYLRHYVGSVQKTTALHTDSLQIAKEKKRQFESAQARGADNPLSTRTPVAEVLEAYVQHIRAIKTPKAAQTDIYYLREMFGECCDALRCTSRTRSAKTRKRRPKSLKDKRKKLPVIEAAYFETITPSQVGAFIDFKVRDQGLQA
jgi:hypothetical protein